MEEFVHGFCMVSSTVLIFIAKIRLIKGEASKLQSVLLLVLPVRVDLPVLVPVVRYDSWGVNANS